MMVRLFASWFGCGYLPKMPGTWGTLGAIPLVLILKELSSLCSLRFDILLIVGAVLTFLCGWLACSKILNQAENDASQTSNSKNLIDPSWVVIDEVSGLLLTCGIVFWGKNLDNPFGIFQFTILLFASFILFRVYDILKPWPIKFIENWMSSRKKFQSFAIMFDDILAAFMAALTLWFCLYSF